MWWWIITILFFLISVGLGVLVYFSLRRINQYEDLIVQFQQIVTFSTEKMKQVDTRGHYESDDETGFFFEQLKELQLILDGVFEIQKIEEKTDAKNKPFYIYVIEKIKTKCAGTWNTLKTQACLSKIVQHFPKVQLHAHKLGCGSFPDIMYNLHKKLLALILSFENSHWIVSFSQQCICPYIYYVRGS